jgi:DNA-binding NarL/FixJ family response regulator
MLEAGDVRVERLRQSVSVLGSSEAKLERARSLVELGGALRRRQQRAEARQHLAAGMDLAYRCGAPRLVARAEDELRAAGAKPRRIAQSGTDALTASELRVGLLAARGRSNPEIAQELYVSLKTIETHLSHAYSKLGLSGQGARKRLAEALGA